MAIEQLGNERTTAYVDGQDLVMERVFEAPRELVWKVMNDPELVTRWWGPQGYTTTVEEMDVRPGGRWRWINHTTGGEDAPFRGEYLEVVPSERVVRTSYFDVPGFDDRPAIETMVLQDLGERTKVTARSTFPSIEDLEGALAVGMIHGALDSYDRLEVLIAEAAATA
ncbi:MAG: SRPBCC domain-containing protein [Candidatus Limnocylindrales bacterium]